MLQFISSLPDFDSDDVTKSLWKRIKEKFNDKDGVCYYKHPVLGTMGGVMADLTLFTTSNEPIAIRCLPYQIDEIESVQEDYWVVNNKKLDSPLLELDDFVIALDSLVKLDRALRRRLNPKGVLALPLISESEFNAKFGNFDQVFDTIWRDDEIDSIISPLDPGLDDEEWLSFRAVIQTATPLTKRSPQLDQDQPKTLSSAIRILDRQIKTLDLEQEKVAIQIPPGPQRIRGLAGTGKTVLLAMRAANIHRHDPDKKILFTFNTRSLYNQTKRLIEQFYGVHRANTEPDWTKVHIRHAWGTQNRAGVYSDICGKNGAKRWTFRSARNKNHTMPLQVCCKHALEELRIESDYDYVIVDEAQDFPLEFFQVLYKLSRNPHRIYWAYDELQSLATASLAMPGPEDLFGRDSEGNPLVVFDDQDYPGNIQKDFILNKSYRCPQDVLMLAHAIGLGLYNPRGCVQMLESRDSWSAIGYEVEGDAEWRTGDKVTLNRPEKNSPNRIGEIYEGHQKLITVKDFQTRDEEFDWVAYSIGKDVNEEEVAPEQIIVIVLNPLRTNEFAAQIQKKLIPYNVAPLIPGITHGVDSYAEEGRVTISSVFRAKGNEAYIVYVVGFEELYNYVNAIENRNRAFTAISRSKAWVRITGIGEGMKKAKDEINKVLGDIPKFHFTFPDMERIRRLSAETPKRRGERKRANKAIKELLDNSELLEASSPDLLERLKVVLASLGNEYNK